MERSSTLISKIPEIGHLPYNRPGSAWLVPDSEPRPVVLSVKESPGERAPEKPQEQDQDWLTIGLLAHLVLLLVFLVVFRERILAAILIEHVFMILAGGLLFLGSARRVGKLLLVVGTLPFVPALPLVLSMLLGR